MALHYSVPNHPALYSILKYYLTLEAKQAAWDKGFSGHPCIMANIIALQVAIYKYEISRAGRS